MYACTVEYYLYTCILYIYILCIYNIYIQCIICNIYTIYNTILTIFHCVYIQYTHIHIFFIHSSLMDACCCCITELLLYLSYCKHAAMNIVLHVSFHIIVFSGYMPWSGIAGSYGNFVFFLSQGEEKES